MRFWTPAAAVSLVLILSAAGCATGPLSGIVRTASPHDQYQDTLRRAGLDRTALGRDWARVSEESLRTAVEALLPFHETGYFAPGDPSAVAYRFELERGRRLEVEVRFDSTITGQLFVDLFRLPASGEPQRVTSMASDAQVLEYDVEEDATYLLRVQPELLRGGRYTVIERTRATLRFPVPDVTAGAIQSGFGAARGSRTHEGIDIFAPRGTAVVAVAGGIARTGTNTLGGNVVWLQEAGRRSYYYAHLDDWAISGVSPVRAGDVLGYVGNTGNARTTSPHLHFGVYAGGAIDPLPFVRPDDDVPAEPTTVSELGTLARVTPRRTPLRAGAHAGADVQRQLDRGSLVTVIGANRRALRVLLPDRSIGYVAADVVVNAEDGGRQRRLAPGVVLLESPAASAPAVAIVDNGVTADVLGAFDGYQLVHTPAGSRGWVLVATTN